METHSHDEAQQVSLDTAAGLSYDYLKQLGTIAMTAAGGLIALVQYVEGDKRFFVKIMIATSMMFLAALLAFLAQYSLVDDREGLWLQRNPGGSWRELAAGLPARVQRLPEAVQRCCGQPRV